MAVQRIRLMTAPESPLPTLNRKLGVLNVGMYCNPCAEFFAFGIEVPEISEFEFVADGPLLVRCPFCKAEEDRLVVDIERVMLTEGRKRRTAV